MSATFFKYAERNVDSQVNWAEVGKGIVDMLGQENKIREEKKAAIDAATREDMNNLANSPQGQFKRANQWVLEYSSDAQQALLIQERLLKNGSINVKDYLIKRQNLNDSTNKMFQIAKEIQAKASEAIADYEGNVTQDLDNFLWKNIEGYGNFMNTKAYIDPTNYNVMIAKMVPKVIDGKTVMVMDDNKDNYVSVDALRNRLNSKHKIYDYVSDVNKQVEALGEFKTAEVSKIAKLYKMASVKEVTDATNRTRLDDESQKTVSAYIEWETNMIKALMSNPYHVTSVLTNAIDKVPGTSDFYEFTFDEKIAKSNAKFILLKDDGSGLVQPEFKPEQQKAVEEFLRAQTRNSIDRKTEISLAAEPQKQIAPVYEWQLDRRDAIKQAEKMGNMLGKMYSGSEGEIVAAMNYIGGMSGVTNVDRTANGLAITRGGETKTFNWIQDGVEVSYDDWVRGISTFITGDRKYMDEILQGAQKVSSGRELNQTFETSFTSDKPNPLKEFENYTGGLIDVNLPEIGETLRGMRDGKKDEDMEKEEVLADQINTFIGSLPTLTGFKADWSRDFKQRVFIYDDKGKEVASIDPNNTTTGGVKRIIQEIIRGRVPKKLEDQATFLRNYSGAAQGQGTSKYNK